MQTAFSVGKTEATQLVNILNVPSSQTFLALIHHNTYLLTLAIVSISLISN
jgi:hypothetical protein